MKQIFLCLFLAVALVGCGSSDNDLTITTTTLPDATIGTAYSHTLVATGGSTSSYTWIVTSGTLPTGLTLGSASGTISGTPVSACSTFTVTVYGDSTSSLRAFTIQSILPAGKGVTLHKNQSIKVPSGTTITDTSGVEVTVTGDTTTTAESFVFAPSSATGAADYTVTVAT